MSDKKAFIFDTNFIVQNQKLDEVVTNLENDYIVYITQVSIDERIAQKCRNIKKDFEAVEECKTKYSYFSKITLKKSFEQECEYCIKRTQKSYDSLFQDRIIPLIKDENTFSRLIDRANMKLPPFSDAKDASDKGFKDCLLWFSLLDYFKTHGEDEIVFVTDDKSAFRNKADFLSQEFDRETGKSIEIKPNSYYKEYITVQAAFPDEEIQPAIPENIESIRDEIEETIDDLRLIEYEDYFGNQQWERTFTTAALFDKNHIQEVFDNLPDVIEKHLFDKTIPASKIFDLNKKIIKDETTIPLKHIEAALALYKEITKRYSEYLEQFFETVAKILNRNYVPQPTIIEDDDLPF